MQTKALQNYHVPRTIISIKTTPTNNRLHKLLQTVNITQEDEQAKETLTNIFIEFQDVFHIKGEELEANNFCT